MIIMIYYNRIQNIKNTPLKGEGHYGFYKIYYYRTITRRISSNA